MRRAWLLFVTIQTLAVGVLAGLVDALTFRSTPLGWSHTRLAPAESGPAAVLGARHVEWVVVPAIVAMYVVVPYLVAVVYSRDDDRHPAFHLTWATAAVLALPLALVAVLTVLSSPSSAARVVGLGVPALAVTALLVGHRVSLSRSPAGSDRMPPPAVFANVGVLLLLLGGMSVGGALAAPAGALVETHDPGSPQVHVEFSTERTDDGTVLVATHAGGDAVEADRLHVVGNGFADVPSAEQTEPGGWRGDASGDAPHAPHGDGRAVVRGDAVRVGVSESCDVMLVYHFGGSRSTVARHECGDE